VTTNAFVKTQALPPNDAGYPPQLLALSAAPTLYVRGALPKAPGVAIVGTRDATEGACAFARALAAGLAAEGFAIWSGGARGIDRAAHEAALAHGASTVVVLGGGLDVPYPPEHAPLFDRVLEAGGALVARVPDLVKPSIPGFHARNVVLAAMTEATVVVQAGLSSGARSTASAARKLGRPLCVVPGAPWDPRGAGCALELSRSEGAVAVSSVADVLAVLGRRAPRPRAAGAKGRGRPRGEPPRSIGPVDGAARLQALDPTERRILDALTAEPVHLDVVCERTSLPAAAVAAALLTLTLEAVVVEGPAGSFRRASSFV
jgi:DNA processing protein